MSLHIYEDIHTPDLEKKQDFFEAWNNAEYSDAYAQLQDNTFNNKKMEATALNNICDKLEELQENTSGDVEDADVIQVALEPPTDLEVGQVYFKVRSGNIENITDNMVGLSAVTNNLFTGSNVAAALQELVNKDTSLLSSINDLSDQIANLPGTGGGTGGTTDDSKVNLSSTTSSLFTGSTVAAALSELKAKDNSLENNISSISTSLNSINAGTQITSGTLPVARGGTGVTSIASLASDLVNTGYVYRVVSRVGTGTTSWSINVGFRPSAFICLGDSTGSASVLSWYGRTANDWIYLTRSDSVSAINNASNEVSCGATSTTFTIGDSQGVLNSSLSTYTYIFFR